MPEGWLTGQGTAMAMIATGPPGGHYADATVSLLADGTYDIAVGTAEFGNGTTTVHRQITAGALGTTVDRIAIRQSDTDVVRHDTGAFGSAGTVVVGKAVLLAAESLAGRLKTFAARYTGVARHLCALGEEALDCAGRTITLKELHEAAHASGAQHEITAEGHWGGSPRSVAFNAQWFRVAVDPDTGEMRILRSVHAADSRQGDEPLAVPRPGGGRSRPGARRHPLRDRTDGRPGRGDHGGLPALPDPAVRRCAAHRGALHGDDRRDRSARRQVDERKSLQPRGPRLRQRAARCHRGPLHGDAGDP